MTVLDARAAVTVLGRFPLLRRIRAFVWRKVRGYPPLDALIARGLLVGQGVTLARGVFLDPAHCHLIEVGDDVTFGPEVMVLAHDASTKTHLDYTRIARVRIGARAFIGARTIVMPGVTIGEDAIIGAGSVVTRDVGAGMVAAGSPARELMTTAEYIERHRQRIGIDPTYGRDEWTYRHGMDQGHARRMAEDLAQTDGYVQ